MASILDSPHIHKRRWRGGGDSTRHTPEAKRERDYDDDDDAHGQDIPARRATGSDGGGDGGGDRTTATGTSHNRVD